MSPLLDVICIVWNHAKITEACLNSLYRNTDPKKFRLIVIDNGSTDGAEIYLKRLKSKVQNMELVVSNKNEGWCQGLNLGFKHLSQDSEYVLWLNNDVLLESNWLEKMLKCFKGGVGAVGPTSNYVAGRQSVMFNHGHDFEYAPTLIGFCLMFRREVIDLVGDVDNRFFPGGSEEYDFIIRMKKELGFGCAIARDVYIHHLGSQSLMDLEEINHDPVKYLEYCRKKDEVLIEKWGESVVNQYLGYGEKQLLIAVPHPGFIHHRFWMDTLFLAKPPGTEFVEVVRTSAIHDARNLVVRKALEGNFKYLLFIDSDMRIPPGAIFKLMSYGKPVTAGYFFSRSGNHFPCAFTETKDREYVSLFEPNSGLKEVDAVGMAFTLIETHVLKQLKDPWFEWGKYGEDIGFCRKVRDLGYKIFVDTDLVIRHIPMFDEHEIGPEDYKPGEFPQVYNPDLYSKEEEFKGGNLNA